MADTHAKHGHDYHLVDPSPWPLIGSIAAFVGAAGAVWWMHGGPPWLALIGLAGILYTMVMWWRDVIIEAEHQGHHTPVVQIGLRYGMALFIASEVMFFVAWFWAYFNAAFYPTEAMGKTWPPQGIETFDPWHLPFMNTVILLLSSCTVTWAHHSIREGDNATATRLMWITVALGALFTVFQGIEYAHAPFTFTGGIYGSTFFMATGFHGFHVIIGTIFLAVCLGRLIKGHFKAEHHFGFEAAAWYWHFVDVVWIFLFSCIYVWGRGAAVPH
jgi:cytochrome c oxidase subunit 3